MCEEKTKGWVCPKCGRVYAPDVKECKGCNSNIQPVTYPVYPVYPYYQIIPWCGTGATTDGTEND